MTFYDIFSVTLITVTLFYLLNVIKHVYNLIRLPPGPIGVPFLGIALKLNPNKLVETLQKWKEEHGDIYSFTLPGHYVVVVNSYDLIKDVLITRSDQFAGRPQNFRQDAMWQFKPTMGFNSISPHWVMVKKSLVTALKMYGERISKLEKISLDVISDMIKEWRSHEGRPFDPQHSLFKVTAKIISSLSLGECMTDEDIKKDTGIQRLFIDIFTPGGKGEILEMMPWLRHFNHPTWTLIEEFVRRTHTLHHPLVDKCKSRFDGENPQCVVDALLLQQQKLRDENNGNDVLTDLDILNDSKNIIGAGIATTQRAAQAFIAILTNHPELQNRLQMEVDSTLEGREPRLGDMHKIPLLEATMLELLRYISHIPFLIPHAVMRDTVLGGYAIPKDTQVWVNAFGLHHDQRYWDEPWEFKPERFLDDHGEVIAPDHPNKTRLLPFGAGRRVCPGEVLAKNRLFLLMVSMLQSFTFEPVSEDERPEHRPQNYVTGFVSHPPDFMIRARAR